MLFTQDLPGRLLGLGKVKTEQNAVEQGKTLYPPVFGYFAKVVATNGDRYTCDVEIGFETFTNVPIAAHMGINSNGEIWGEFELPQIGDYVLVQPIDPQGRKKVIIGTLYPYMTSPCQQQTPVNSTSKQFTKKLLEANKPKLYRHIYPSGTTIEVQEDGSTIIETPSGLYVQMDETNHKVVINNNLEVLQ